MHFTQSSLTKWYKTFERNNRSIGSKFNVVPKNFIIIKFHAKTDREKNTKRENWKNGLTGICTQISTIKAFCEIWFAITTTLKIHTHTNTHRSQTNRAQRQNEKRAPIKIFITPIGYSTAKPFNLIDYKSWALVQTSNKKKKRWLSKRESEKEKQGKRAKNVLRLCLHFSHIIDDFFIEQIQFYWRQPDQWKNFIFFYRSLVDRNGEKTATTNDRNRHDALELQYSDFIFARFGFFHRNFN